MYRSFVKPVCDLILSMVLFIVTFPVFIMVALVLLLVNRGNPFFIQPRPGKHGKIFRVIKFKTMNDKRDAAGKLLPDAERLTPVGKFVRKTSLDEMPQLLNVIKGDMSIIGPRPLLAEYLPLYSPEQSRRHDVRPGITGWAQVNGRNAIQWEEKFKFDVWYVDHVSCALDLKILFMTITKVFKREGISMDGHETMERFKGNTL